MTVARRLARVRRPGQVLPGLELERRLLGWDEEADKARVRRAAGRVLSGRRLSWCGPGEAREWDLAEPIAARRARGVTVLARLDGIPVAALRGTGEGRLVELGLDPGGAPAIGAVLRRSLAAAPAAAAWLDLAGTVALRLDDPGASASVHLRGWAYERAGEPTWDALGRELAGADARLTVAYTPGWVDDGEPARGELLVAGHPVERVPGRVHPSPLVRYRARSGPSADCAAEHAAIATLRRRGLVSLELHGHTHLHPDLDAWAAAADRYDSIGWYRELAPETAAALATRPAAEHPVALGLALFREHLGEEPVALVCPGNGWTEAVLATAHAHGLELVAADALAIRGRDAMCWPAGIATHHFAQPPVGSLDSELPAVACLHDRDLALDGAQCVGAALARWRAAGARRFVDLRELAAAFGLRLSMRREPLGWRLHAFREHGPPLSRRFPIAVRLPDQRGGELITVTAGGTEALALEPAAGGVWRAELPAGL